MEPMEVRFGNIVMKSEDSKDVVFYKEIRMELDRAGIAGTGRARTSADAGRVDTKRK